MEHLRRQRVAVAIALLFAVGGIVPAQEPDDPVLKVGNGVTVPKILRKVDPKYSPEGEAEKIQGTVLYSVVVGKDGKARDIEVLSPLGYGLDEQGVEAIRQWVFAPGMKDGKPVSIAAQVEINFWFKGIGFNAAQEKQRTSYNAAVHNLQIPAKKTAAVEAILKLSDQKYPPGMSLVGRWMLFGTEVPKDVATGVALIQRAAVDSDGNGLFLLGTLTVKGQYVPPDVEKGLKLMRDASTHGSLEAQYYLGTKYQAGEGLNAADPERARYYFRLCATRGVAACEFNLGKLLMPVTGGAKGDPVQALAWLEMARDGAIQDAAPLAESVRAKLAPEDIGRAEKFKTQLLRK